jgi:hypothetical protein
MSGTRVTAALIATVLAASLTMASVWACTTFCLASGINETGVVVELMWHDRAEYPAARMDSVSARHRLDHRRHPRERQARQNQRPRPASLPRRRSRSRVFRDAEYTA